VDLGKKTFQFLQEKISKNFSWQFREKFDIPGNISDDLIF